MHAANLQLRLCMTPSRRDSTCALVPGRGSTSSWARCAGAVVWRCAAMGAWTMPHVSCNSQYQGRHGWPMGHWFGTLTRSCRIPSPCARGRLPGSSSSPRPCRTAAALCGSSERHGYYVMRQSLGNGKEAHRRSRTGCDREAKAVRPLDEQSHPMQLEVLQTDHDGVPS